MRRALVAIALVACAHARPVPTSPCDHATARLAQLNLRPTGTCAYPKPRYLACLDAAKTIEAALDCDEAEGGGLVIPPRVGGAGLGIGGRTHHKEDAAANDAPVNRHAPQGRVDDRVVSCRKALRRARLFSPDLESLDDDDALSRCVLRATDAYLTCVAAAADQAGFLACEQEEHGIFLSPKP